MQRCANGTNKMELAHRARWDENVLLCDIKRASIFKWNLQMEPGRALQPTNTLLLFFFEKPSEIWFELRCVRR